ncbi:hypothetical protein V8E36_001712 [Tilletia maclaganii]
MICLTKCPELQNEACAKLQDRKSSSFQSQLPTPTIARSRDKSTASSSSAVSNQHILNLRVYRADIDHYGERGQIIGFSFLHDHDLNGDVLARSEAVHLSQHRKRVCQQAGDFAATVSCRCSLGPVGARSRRQLRPRLLQRTRNRGQRVRGWDAPGSSSSPAGAWYKRANQRLAAMGSSNGIGLGFGRRVPQRSGGGGPQCSPQSHQTKSFHQHIFCTCATSLVERLQLTLENLDGTGSIFHFSAVRFLSALAGAINAAVMECPKATVSSAAAGLLERVIHDLIAAHLPWHLLTAAGRPLPQTSTVSIRRSLQAAVVPVPR